MKKNINVLILCGGGSSEHDISIQSANYIEEQIKKKKDDSLKIYKKELKKNESYLHDKKIDYIILSIHGKPGENGEIQKVLESQGVPYFGASSKASELCFDKVLTKRQAESIQIPVAPYIVLEKENINVNEQNIESFLKEHKHIFIKPSNEGSSFGCYCVKKKSELSNAIENAFKFLIRFLLKGIFLVESWNLHYLNIKIK